MIADIAKSTKEVCIDIDYGDVVVLYSDGISEARYQSVADGEMYGVGRIMQAIGTANIKTAQNIFEHITNDLSLYM
jgi:serine phosphatase RsbU (regulator of sigma subunit)